MKILVLMLTIFFFSVCVGGYIFCHNSQFKHFLFHLKAHIQISHFTKEK